MRIYRSAFPPVPLVNESIFTNLFRRRYDLYPPDAPAFVDAATGLTITRAQTRQLSLAFAHGLRVSFAAAGGVPLGRGDVVLVFCPNTIAWPAMLFGGWAAGLRMTLANSAYTPREVAYQWRDSGAKAILVHPTLLPTVLNMFKLLDMDSTEARRRIIIADWGIQPKVTGSSDYISMEDLMGNGSLAKEEEFYGDQARETTLLCYSSGTTGQPKGVELTHRNMTSVFDMTTVLWPKEYPNPRMLGVLPFYHVYGAAILLAYQYHQGVPLVMMQQFEPVAYCRAIEQYKITDICVVPPVCLALLHHPALKQYNVKSLRLVMSAAAPLSLSLLTMFNEKLHSLGANISIIQGYGLTETSPTATMLPTKDYLRKPGSVGVLLPNLEVRLVREDGNDAADEEPGEFWVRGPTIFKGYLNKPEATRNAITEDGWFKTGDILTRDSEGHFRVVDRLKELIKYKGFQVAPAELESVLLEHPDIVDVGVIGVWSEGEATELPRAYVVHAQRLGKQEREVFASRVGEWIKGRVARHKYLRGGTIVVDAIPKSAAGKILRRELREQAKAELQAAEAARAKL